MKGLIQRVNHASVTVDDQVVGEIERGILLFLGIEKNDTKNDADKLLKKILGYRVFPDDSDRMNLSLTQIQGGLLVVSQFTLVADTGKGLRPGFSSAAPAAEGELLYDYFINQAKIEHPQISTGCYGVDMKVQLINDGPVTFMLSA